MKSTGKINTLLKQNSPENGVDISSGSNKIDRRFSNKELSEQEVIVGLKNGNESILGYVYNQYSKGLYRFGQQYTSDHDLVIDCLHDVFLNLITKKKLLKNIKSIKPYLFTSMYHQVIYQVKRKRKIDSKTLEAQKFAIDFHVESKIILDEEGKEKLSKVNSAIKNLSRKQRQALLHFYKDGFTHDEIAMIMGLTNSNSVAKLIARGLSSIRKDVMVIVLISLCIY